MISTFIVDSFTDVPFRGNPAGVCLVDRFPDDSQMLAIASELGLSETAFVFHASNNDYAIRYFSPKMEIPLCGHATLASAKVLLSRNQTEPINFKTVQGLDLKTRRAGDLIAMQFPVFETRPVNVSNKLTEALGIHDIRNTVYNEETRIILIEISCTDELAELVPDFPALLKSHDSINGVVVTAQSKGDEFDFHSRYFWPWSGTNEDPVTGGTHTFLAPYWSTRLGKTVLRSFQSSKRTGWMHLSLIGNNRLEIQSAAVIVFEGTLQMSLDASGE